MNALETFAAWIADAPRDHGETAVAPARRAFLDTLGCMLAGAGEPASAGVRRAVARWGDGPCTVVGSDRRVPAPWAAMANGTAAHALDFDDYEDPGATHPSAVLVPALLALGEERQAPGGDLLDGYIAGLEIIVRLGAAVNLSHYHRGWHATGTLGAVGAAAAGARLLKLNVRDIGYAIGLAASMASGFKSQFGTMAKPLHAGLAAKAGVLAASLAAEGMTASAEVFDGEWSILRLMAGPEAEGFAGALRVLGDPLAIEAYGLVIKPYPCCGYIHGTLEGILDLRRAEGLSAPDIAGIIAQIPARNAEILMYPRPETPMQARFSLPYCAAVAALHGAVTVADFAPEAVARPEVRAWLPKVTLETHPIHERSSDLSCIEPSIVTLRLARGGERRIEVAHPRGTPARPLSDGEMSEKFRSCAAGVLSAELAAAAAARIADLDCLADVGELMRHLRTAPN
jgi:2-methylcitrate dehydratase PrpD